MGRAPAAAPSKTKSARAVAVARADPGAAGGFDGSLSIPNARPTGSAGPGAPDPEALGPERSMGARAGAPDRHSRSRTAESSAEPAGDGPEPSASAPDDSSAGGGGSGDSPAAASGDAAQAGSGDPAAAPPGKHGHRGHRGAAPPDPSSSDPSSSDPSGTSASDPSTPDAASPDDEKPDADAPAGTPGRRHHVLAQVIPVVGVPVLRRARPSGNMFAAAPGGPATVQTSVAQTATAKAVAFTTQLDIDPNGAGGWYHASETAQPRTALRYPDGKSLNPGKIPYVVIPRNFTSVQPEVKLGDYAAVAYGGKTVYAIVGDYGPPGVVGGGSLVLASGLGINPDPKQGGVGSGVSYTLLGGSAGSAIPIDAAGVEAAGKTAFDKAGIPVR
ncbi:MAG TPA: glycoside hydrolase family 75 protein [Elusimicrobiota bacterium]|nr:glycoside hydrolase family 75 protein [Elusimicrobiota bacterium]